MRETVQLRIRIVQRLYFRHDDTPTGTSFDTPLRSAPEQNPSCSPEVSLLHSHAPSVQAVRVELRRRLVSSSAGRRLRAGGEPTQVTIPEMHVYEETQHGSEKAPY